MIQPTDTRLYTPPTTAPAENCIRVSDFELTVHEVALNSNTFQNGPSSVRGERLIDVTILSPSELEESDTIALEDERSRVERCVDKASIWSVISVVAAVPFLLYYILIHKQT